MNENWVRLCVQVKRSIDIIKCVLGHNQPPPSLAFACHAPMIQTNRPSLTYGSIQELIKDASIVFGVPKFRTSKPKKITRKFSPTRLLDPVENLVTCPSCSNVHPADTICDSCYEKVRLLTNEIKRKMMNYNPYVGERQDKDIFVKFRSDKIEAEDVVNGKRVIEIEKERPSWFKKLLVEKK